MIRRALILALAATALLRSDVLAGGGAAQPTRYLLEVTLDYSAGTLVVHEEVTYSNRTGVDLSELVFNVTPAYFEAFSLGGCYDEGRPVDCPLRGVSLHLPLTDPLPPEGQRQVSLDFTITVPQRQGRFGRNAELMALGNWYPVVNVYRGPRLASEGRPPGWAEHEYTPIGDPFFTETASYEVAITTLQPVVLAHTGREVRREGPTTYIEAKQVRDFALAVSDSYRTLTRFSDGVRLTVYHLPGHEEAAAQYLETAAAVLAWTSEMLAPYPWPQLVLAEMPYPGPGTGGQEYPQLILLGANLADYSQGHGSTPEVIVAHEVLHQWFYAWVGSDQVYEPWLDEALVTWLSMHYTRMNFPKHFDWVWETWVENPRQAAEENYGTLSVGLSLPEGADGNLYFASVYHQGALFIEQLYQVLGEEAFLGLLREYVTLFGHRIATASAFLDLVQSKTSANLWPLFYENLGYQRYRYPEPPRLGVIWPPHPAGTPLVASLVGADVPPTVQAILDEVPVPARVADKTIEVSLGEDWGESRLLTLTLYLADGRRVDRVTLLSEQQEVTPTPWPTAVAPQLTPSPTAAPLTEVGAPARQAPPADGGRRQDAVLLAAAVAAMVVGALGLGAAVALWRRGSGT